MPDRKEPDEVFFITLKCGQDVEVSWYKDYFRDQDHIEFRGPVSETGYYSYFPRKEEGTQIGRDVMIDHLQEVAEGLWKKNKAKDGAQKALF